jgi:hypothetical protein
MWLDCDDVRQRAGASLSHLGLRSFPTSFGRCGRFRSFSRFCDDLRRSHQWRNAKAIPGLFLGRALSRFSTPLRSRRPGAASRSALDGEVTEFATFGNIVPTGLAVRGNAVYLAQAGPVPHLPEDGKVVTIRPQSGTVTEVASGAPLLVDVELGRGRRLYALSQGDFLEGELDGRPALPNTGALVEVDADGTFTVIVEGLNQPTSLELIGNTAYVVNLAGEIVKIDNVSGPPFGVSH